MVRYSGVPRIRSIKPEFWEDMKLARDLNREQRLFYIGLWNQADDAGRFLAHPRRLLGAVFPYDADLSTRFIDDSLNVLVETGRLVLYEVAGEPYGQLTKFPTHQRINRPTESRIPEPTTTSIAFVNGHGILTESSEHPARALELEQVARSREQVSGKELEEDAASGPTSKVEEENLEQTIDQLIMTVNRGMIENSGLRSAEPIPPSHGPSRQVVSEWLAEGIPADVIRRVLLDRARSYRPVGRHKQIHSLKYFENAVRSEWDKFCAGNLPGISPAELDASRSAVASTESLLNENRKADQSITEQRKRVEVWRKEHPAEAAKLSEECLAEGKAQGMDALGKSGLMVFVEARFQARVIEEHLKPKLAAS